MAPGMDGDGGAGLLLGDDRPLHGPALRLCPRPGTADLADDSGAHAALSDTVEDVGHDVSSDLVNALIANLG